MSHHGLAILISIGFIFLGDRGVRDLGWLGLLLCFLGVL